MSRAIASRHMRMNSFIKGYQANRILLPIQEVCNGGGQKLCVLQFGDRGSARIFHRSARIDEQMTLRVCIGAILLNEVAISSTEQAPVEITKIVSLIVLAILCELGGESGVG